VTHPLTARESPDLNEDPPETVMVHLPSGLIKTEYSAQLVRKLSQVDKNNSE
jgi:hypothetical protein